MIDINCETWQDVVNFIEQRRAKFMSAVLAVNADERTADYYRGAYAVLVDLTKLPFIQTEARKRNG